MKRGWNIALRSRTYVVSSHSFALNCYIISWCDFRCFSERSIYFAFMIENLQIVRVVVVCLTLAKS